VRSLAALLCPTGRLAGLVGALIGLAVAIVELERAAGWWWDMATIRESNSHRT
jgi:hypothetical protein